MCAIAQRPKPHARYPCDKACCPAGLTGATEGVERHTKYHRPHKTDRGIKRQRRVAQFWRCFGERPAVRAAKSRFMLAA